MTRLFHWRFSRFDRVDDQSGRPRQPPTCTWDRFVTCRFRHFSDRLKPRHLINMQSGRSYWDLTEGQRSDVICAPDDRILRPPLAAFDVGQCLGRRATGQFQVDGFAGAAMKARSSRRISGSLSSTARRLLLPLKMAF